MSLGFRLSHPLSVAAPAPKPPRYDADERQAPLSETHRLISIKTAPIELGFPIRRKRSLASGINLNNLVWCGPETLKDIQEEFDTLYSRDLVLDGSIYFTASDEEIFKTHEEVALSKRGKKSGHSVFGEADHLNEKFRGKGLLASGASRVVLTAPNHVIASESEEEMRRKGIEGGHRFCDLDQHPGFGSKNTPAN